MRQLTAVIQGSLVELRTEHEAQSRATDQTISQLKKRMEVRETERWSSTLSPDQKPPGEPSPWQPPKNPSPSASYYPRTSIGDNINHAQVAPSRPAMPPVINGNGAPTASWTHSGDNTNSNTRNHHETTRAQPETGGHQRRRSTSIYWGNGHGSEDDGGEENNYGGRKPPSPNGSFPDPVFVTSSPAGPAPCQYNISIREPPPFRPEAYASYKHEVACWQEIHTQFPQYSLVAAIASSATGTHQRLMARFLKETRTCIHERTLEN